MSSTERKLQEKIKRLEDEIQELRDELHLNEAENIELDMEKRDLKSENDDIQAKLNRLRRQHARSEADRRKCSAKYNNLLDELNMSSDELLKDLAFYRRKSDDLEKDLENERKSWQNTLKVLENEKEEAILMKNDMGASLDELDRKLAIEKQRNRELMDDIENLIADKEDAEQAFREEELKTAKLLNEHTGLNLKVQSMYSKQARYKKQIRTMCSKDLRAEEVVSKAMRNMDDDDSYYDDRSQKEDDYKYSRKENDRKRRPGRYEARDDRSQNEDDYKGSRKENDRNRRSDRYETRGRSASPSERSASPKGRSASRRGRSASPTPEWGD